ncbi:hypothetical protein NBRC116595_17300 [Aliiglaciecola sp. NS0011-25]
MIRHLSALFLLVFSTTSYAHPMHESQVEAQQQGDQWLLAIHLPQDRLQAALKEVPNKDSIGQYVTDNMTATSEQDHNLLWSEKVDSIVPPDDHGYWHVNVRLSPPEGGRNTAIDLQYQVIIERIVTHKAQVWLLPAKELGANSEPKLLAKLRRNNTSVTLSGVDTE